MASKGCDNGNKRVAVMGGRGRAKEFPWPPEDRKVRETDSPFEPPEGASPEDTMTLAQ